jgi:predicted secreted hydrolase
MRERVLRRSPRIFSAILLILALITLAGRFPRRAGPAARAQPLALAQDATGFARAEGPQPLSFPADHGPHTDYQTEWWYYTGNLQSADGRHFGYQLTFFRRALLPPPLRQERPSAWATDQVYLAHFALSDVAAGRYRAFERFSRGAAGLAGAQAPPYRATQGRVRLWLEDWSVTEITPNVYQLRAAEEDLEIELQLTDLKGPIPQGDQGYSQKGPERGNASYYYSLTRLASSGSLRIGDIAYGVDGWSWMDHEFSTSALAADQVGWDWFSLQLDDGGELMVFQIRKEDGSVDPFSSGTFIAPDGRTTPLSRDDFQISVGTTWRSPHSGATYPAHWTLNVPALDLILKIAPHLADQELNVSYTYWEGAVRVSGQRAGQALSGNGYVELTGYADSMQNQF